MKGSLAETLFNTIVGFGINYTANVALLPLLWDHNRVATSAFHIGVFFTVISVLRGFGVRRLFNRPKFAAWIERMNTHLEKPAAWLKSQLASAMSRARAVARKTTSRGTTTDTHTALLLAASTENPARASQPPGVPPGEAVQPWIY